ncbi:MAG: LVIVD repeat-containing protein [Actinomycetota bacterium]
MGRPMRMALCIVLLCASAGAGRAGAPPDVSDACRPGDRPETGPSGQVPLADQLSGRSAEGYSCNLSLIGSSDLGSGGDTQMTWYEDCAYRVVPTGSGDGVAVVDLANPAEPELVSVLQEPEWNGRGGILGIHEGIHASASRGILVVPIGTMLTAYDVAGDCRSPQLVSHFDFGFPSEPFKGPAFQGAGIHSGQLSPDGTFYYATDIGNGAVSPTGPCLTIVDLADLANPKLVMRWGDEFPCHDLDFNADGTRAYLGFYASMVGHPSAVVGAFTPVVQPAHLLSGLRIVDTSEVQARVANPEIQILGELTGGRQHTETFTRIGGRSYVVAAEEGFCPGGNARIVDVTDDAHPVAVSELTLAVNTLPGCLAAQADLDVGSNLLLYMSHYVSVDDPADASLAFISWYGSGLRVFDIRDPLHPREVAYYNPPVVGSDRVHDSTTTYPRYVADTGTVWVGSAVNALSILSLDPSLRP